MQIMTRAEVRARADLRRIVADAGLCAERCHSDSKTPFYKGAYQWQDPAAHPRPGNPYELQQFAVDHQQELKVSVLRYRHMGHHEEDDVIH
jgi:hypothetical protein